MGRDKKKTPKDVDVESMRYPEFRAQGLSTSSKVGERDASLPSGDG